MVKFVIEVSEEFIKNEANPENLKKESGDGLRSIITMIALSAIEAKIAEGQKEFTVKEATLSESGRKLFKSTLSEVAMLSIGEKEGKEASDEK